MEDVSYADRCAFSRRKRLGEILVSAGFVDQKKLNAALIRQKSSGERLGAILLDMGLSEAGLARALAQQLNLEVLDPAADYDPALSAGLSSAFLIKKGVFPLTREGRRIRVAMNDPLDFSTISDLEFLLGGMVQPVVATPSGIRRLVQKRGREDEETTEMLRDAASGDSVVLIREDEDEADLTELKKTLEAPPIIRMVNLMLYEAYRTNATDIHVERKERETRVRYRIDGLLQDRFSLPEGVHAAVISRLKVMAGMDISVRLRPQDGGAKIRMGSRRIDLRMSSLPTLHGEKMVVRLLGNQDGARVLSELGMLPRIRRQYQEVLHHPQGFLIVTGPTGAGKTTTLYASLAEVHNDTVNVVSVEDPVEYHICGVNQVHVNNRAGITFASGLRSILRQDPNIIMVGEIRDLETAQIAFQASLTGHLVLSTLHARNAVAGFTRLFDLGIQPYLLASSLTGLVAQRLVRRNCTTCSTRQELDADTKARYRVRVENGRPAFFRGSGCPQCRQTGFSGRVGVYEVLKITDAIRGLVIDRAPEREILACAMEEGMTLMEQNATYLVLKGSTAAEEVLRTMPPGDILPKEEPGWDEQILALFDEREPGALSRLASLPH
ncbi:MAG: Flp pilus assembly complex ATPase component TadA [Deltaproteobacteria bacterium]|nr:Flp pilus assembly complex ATPase component TadA [Deltaproteobacteria bacterium]